MKITRLAAAATGVSLLWLAGTAGANDYSDPDYLAYDIDNMSRTLQRQTYHVTTDSYRSASFDTFTRTWIEGIARQVGDAQHGRVYTGLGQVLPGGNVGDPEAYHLGARTEVEFLTRTGAKLVANVWPCEGGGRCPGIVITTGSIQVTQHMYGWAARALQMHGYTVMTYDVQGQGESEGTSHSPGSTVPIPANPQSGPNFTNTTVDALLFLLSSDDEEYVPAGWDAEDVSAAKATAGGSDKLNWYNPHHRALDPTRLGLAGHSLGAGAVSTVQQCSDLGGSTLWQTVSACMGRSFPIQAIVAWDSLSSGVAPVVPALDHEGDGYFINAVPTPSAPSPAGHLGAFDAWRAAEVDAAAISVRGGTHAEWSQIPYIVSATRYGVPQAAYYMLAWFDRYVHPDRAVEGTEAMLAGPVPAEPAGSHAPWRASLFSVKYTSAYGFTGVVDGDDGEESVFFDVPDLRAFAGVAPVGDWTAANAEAEGLQ